MWPILLGSSCGWESQQQADNLGVRQGVLHETRKLEKETELPLWRLLLDE